MAASVRDSNTQPKSPYNHVSSTPGQNDNSLTKNQAEKVPVDEVTEVMRPITIIAILDERLDQLSSRLETLLTKRIEELEKKFDNMNREIQQVR